jgi:hypothetical protein
MKRFLSLAAILATALPGVALAGVHMWGLSDHSTTTTRTYQPNPVFLVGSPGPGAGALISQKSSGANGFQGGIAFRTASEKARVMGSTGALLLSGGLDEARVGVGNSAFMHTRMGVDVTSLFLPASPVQLGVGAAVGYTMGRTLGGADIARFRVTPALSLAYQAVRLTYRQSPWSIPGESAPRDILGHLYFEGLGPVHGMGVLTVGALVPDVRTSASDGYVVAVQTPRFHGVGARLSYTSGFQGVTSTGPFNPSRPWDSYSAGESVDVSYQVRPGVSVGLYAALTHNSSGSATKTVITEKSARSRLVGLTLSDRF